MAAANNATSETGAVTSVAEDRVLLIKRTLDAPRSLVFRMWAEPRHLAQWWGPKDFTVPMCEMDFRIGGAYRARIVSPEGTQYVMRGIYREILEPQRIVFTFAWEETGERGMDNLITVDLLERGKRTELTFRQAPFQSIAERDSHHHGWSQSFDRLDVLLATVP